MSQSLLKSTAVVSGLTLISRVLGFVRDMLIARLFGVDLATDAFFVAFKLPNFCRRLFTEGAVAHAFIPILSRYQVDNDNVAAQQLLSKVASAWTLVFFFITLLSVLAAPLLLFLLAPGLYQQHDQNTLAISLLHITLPYLFFVALVALAGSVLNAYQQFIVPALTPALLNISMIVAALWLAPQLAEPITALSWGVFIGGAAQLALQIPPLWRLGLLPRWQLHWHDAETRLLFKRLVPMVFSVSVTQINLLLDTLFASLLATGSVSWLYYSDRLVEFPQGLLGMALGMVILPHLAQQHAQANTVGFSHALDWGVRLVWLTGLPATLGLVLLAEPILATLFQSDAFTAFDVQQAGHSLQAYALGLLGFLMIKVLVPAFTARHDLKTPLRYSIYSMVFSLIGNILAIPLAHAGLALATSLGATLNAILLGYHLRRTGVYQPARGGLWFMAQVMLASTAMSVGLYYTLLIMPWQHWTTLERIIGLSALIALGGLIYGITLLLLGFRWQKMA